MRVAKLKLTKKSKFDAILRVILGSDSIEVINLPTRLADGPMRKRLSYQKKESRLKYTSIFRSIEQKITFKSKRQK